ncbi:hypothetical protein [Campylobacter pinnipediorum]|uniref:hypothetical protein n=1 Tax=Campylobacter pinnipediorum TaxID=1965231 RepID=UPI00084DB7AC|nr:hypothetical protein [Campylobacter pinnipediorum]AQW80786.1 hypothetical protein CPIN17260_0458 [Campylobacter pinnipediorum subsp. pinnipediorum]AQW83328.1 hypothetical protein CPIN17261_1330 [Campylobacter pinnipediorum subsp. pinnipediorum]OPA75428.1 hypothetical protein BFG05_06025 [Campylobacter pinnipediorum subsp. pinnipediorum]
MREIIDIFKKLKEIYPEAKTVYKEGVQTGVYLAFNGINNKEWKKDIASFTLYVGARSLDADKNSVIALLDELRARTISKANFVFGEEIFKNIEFVSFESSLYVYSIGLEIPLYRENDDDYLGDEI